MLLPVSSQGYDFASAGALGEAASCQTGTASEKLKQMGVNREHHVIRITDIRSRQLILATGRLRLRNNIRFCTHERKAQ
jgi:hypothetical protein